MVASADQHAASLLDLRDELAVTRQLVVALCLACQAPHLPDVERRALAELANVIRQRLETSLAALDEVVAKARATTTMTGGGDT